MCSFLAVDARYEDTFWFISSIERIHVAIAVGAISSEGFSVLMWSSALILAMTKKLYVDDLRYDE